MRFLSIKACTKAFELGCESESGLLFKLKDGILTTEVKRQIYTGEGFVTYGPEAFIEQDFTGSTAQARKNAELVFGPLHKTSHEDQGRQFNRECKCCNCLRHKIIDSEDGIKIIEEALEKYDGK